MSQPSDISSTTTILVVDDNEAVLQFVVSLLTKAEYRVLAANSPAQALALAGNLETRIDVLLSDLEMPHMMGPELGAALKKARPDLHVLFMSGMAGGDLLVLNYGWAFIEKPFVPTKLLQMIRNVLTQPNKSQGVYGFDTRKDATLHSPQLHANDRQTNSEHPKDDIKTKLAE